MRTYVLSRFCSRAEPRASISLLALAALALGCQYDIDKIYEHTPGPEATPEHLIDLWKDPALSDDCRACARSECADENSACRGDAECLALTRCVAQAKDPAAQNACRAAHIDWLREDIAGRDIGGPYQQCVFLNNCTTPCEGRTQLACTDDFTWPTKAGGGSITMHLRFVDGLSGRPPSGMRVRACQQENPSECLELTRGWLDVDDRGEVDVNVGLTLGAFTGYLELEGGGLYPTLLRFGWPISTDLVTSVTVISRGSVTPLINSSVVNVDPDLGLLQLRMFGCSGLPTRDVGFSVDQAGPETQAWYTSGTDILPDFNLEATGDRGAGGIINVALGGRRLSASYEDMEVVRNVRAPSRGGYMTIVVVYPDDSTR